MKSKRASEYLAGICWAGVLIYGDPGQCDLKLKKAKQAVELAEEEMAEKAAKAFCFCKCGIGPCIMQQVGRDECKDLREFKRKMEE